MANEAKQTGERYVVRPVRGMGLGAGGFTVLDTATGHETTPMLWREDAERIAARLHRQYLADMQREQDLPNWGG